jgi:hypothetical protein
MLKKIRYVLRASIFGLTPFLNFPYSAISAPNAVDTGISRKGNFATEKRISGKVTDEQGRELPGVNVTVKGTTRGTSTDVNGTYSIDVNSDTEILVFSFVGYLAKEITIGAASALNVQLDPDTKALEEVVVVGYGSQKKATITGSIASIKGDAIARVCGPMGGNPDKTIPTYIYGVSLPLETINRSWLWMV